MKNSYIRSLLTYGQIPAIKDSFEMLTAGH